MAKIFCIMGKSSSGKDTIYRKLLKDKKLALKKIITYTTRPMRDGEKEGVQYFFKTKEEMDAFEAQGRLVEKRVYHTILGDWYYFTVDDGQVEKDGNYIIITTLDQFSRIRDYWKEDKVLPIYIEVDDGERLKRALRREMSQEKPQYEEMCRRFLADNKDFSKENLEAAKVDRVFENRFLKETVETISNYILSLEKS